ncbi:hypothetical protein Glove_772g24 [Diversispora epigaea]|uniref:Uncharacterized protein n=1 Tax=Diversispora epigaea TaxID=1348612 RepID=A0A397G2C2_9GLOM|nr:hypothetical protein Glove_772g24 [Diversispora epigaea]
MANAQSTVDSLKELNSRLIAEIDKLRKENADIKAENIKLKKDKEEVEARFTNLEQRDKEKSNLIAKLQQSDKEKTNLITKLEQNDKDTVARIAKLEQKQSQDVEKSNFIAKLDDDTRENNQSSINITSTETENSNDTHDTPASDIINNTSNSDELNNVPNSDVSFEDKEIEFLERIHKEQIRNGIRERNREKKLLRNNEEPTFHDQDPIQKNYTPQINQNVLEEPQTRSTISSQIKIPYNQKVEQGLLHELFEFIRGTNSMSLQSLKKTPLNSIFVKQISDIPVDIDLTPDSVPHLVRLFGKAEKTGRKEKLRWYYYSEEYEKKVSNLSSEKNIGDQMTRTQIYDEMMQYLPGIKREYLRKMTQKARTISSGNFLCRRLL